MYRSLRVLARLSRTGGNPSPKAPSSSVKIYASATSSPHAWVASSAPSSSRRLPLPLLPSSPVPKTSHFVSYVSPAALRYELPALEWCVPEVLFLGRSNVGKSELMREVLTLLSSSKATSASPKGGDSSNSVYRTLPRSGKTAGKTKSVNYYGVWPKSVSSQRGLSPPSSASVLPPSSSPVSPPLDSSSDPSSPPPPPAVPPSASLPLPSVPP